MVCSADSNPPHVTGCEVHKLCELINAGKDGVVALVFGLARNEIHGPKAETVKQKWYGC